MLKKRAASLFIDLFFFVLFNSIVLRGYLDSPATKESLGGFIYSFLGFMSFNLILILFTKASPGALLIGISFRPVSEHSWIRSYLMKYSYHIIILLLCAALLIHLKIDTGSLTNSGHPQLLRNIVFTDEVRAVFLSFLCLLAIDSLQVIFNKSQQTITEKWAQVELH